MSQSSPDRLLRAKDVLRIIAQQCKKESNIAHPMCVNNVSDRYGRIAVFPKYEIVHMIGADNQLGTGDDLVLIGADFYQAANKEHGAGWEAVAIASVSFFLLGVLVARKFFSSRRRTGAEEHL
jgi:hypothetical protein